MNIQINLWLQRSGIGLVENRLNYPQSFTASASSEQVDLVSPLKIAVFRTLCRSSLSNGLL